MGIPNIIEIFRENSLKRILRLIKLRLQNRKPKYFYSAKIFSDSIEELRKLYLTQIDSFRIFDDTQTRDSSNLLSTKTNTAANSHQRTLATASSTLPKVTTLLSTNRPNRVMPTLRTLAAQTGVELNVVIATHGFMPDSYKDTDLAQTLNVRWLSPTKETSLGEIYNQILDLADTEFVAKIDDDDWYDSHYLQISIDSLQRSQAGITGKNAVLVYSEKDDAVYLRMPHKHHRYVFSVSGGTIVARTEVAKQIKFASLTIGEDQDFLSRAFDSGVKIYSSSPFGYVYRRGETNTWDSGSDFLGRDAILLHKGLPGEFECVENMEMRHE